MVSLGNKGIGTSCFDLTNSLHICRTNKLPPPDLSVGVGNEAESLACDCRNGACDGPVSEVGLSPGLPWSDLGNQQNFYGAPILYCVK